MRWSLAVIVAASVGGVVPAAAAASSTTTVAVAGTLISVFDEAEGHPVYALEDGAGTTVQLEVSFDRPPRTPARWSGRIAVPERIRSRVGNHAAGATVLAELVRTGGRARVVSGAAAPTQVAPGPTAHHWYVAVLTGLGTTISNAAAEDLADDVASYWKSQSNGKISAVTVDEPVRYASAVATAGDCGLGTTDEWLRLRTEAMAKFPAADFYEDGDQIMLFVPEASCSGSTAVGMGELGASFASGGFTVVRDDPDLGLSTAGHEVGHNYGFEHAGLFGCGQAIASCMVEYGGIYDVMGYAVGGYPALPALNTAYRVITGITDPGEVAQADFSAPFSRSWTIQPRSATSGQRSVHLVDPDDGSDVWLDYRDGSGQDAGAAYASGISLDYGVYGFGDVEYGPGVVLERLRAGYDGFTAVTPAADGIAALTPGASWSNRSGSLTVTMDTVSGGAAQVTVVYAPTGSDPGPGTVSLSGNYTFGDGTYVNADIDGWRDDATVNYTWLRDGAVIPGADHVYQYIPSAADVDHDISVRATGSFAEGGWIHSVTSDPVRIEPGEITVTATPTLSGTPKVGSRLSAVGGDWDQPWSTVEWHWQWRADDIEIAADDSRFFTLTGAQAGSYMRACQVLEAEGYQTTTICSTALGPVTSGTAPDPIAPAPYPTIAGTPRVGVRLTAHVGTWDAAATLSRQWLVGGVTVATGTSFVPRPADLGKRVTFRVVATKDGAEVSRQASTGTVAAGRLSGAVPRIAGTAKIGRTLKATVGTWTSGAKLSYAWFANGKKIAKASRKSLKLTKALKGKRIVIKVTGQKTGYATLVRSSKATAKVRR